jgi:hypothetical protein
MAGPNGIYTWVFTYWEAGDKVTRASSIPTEKVFGSLGKLGEWLRTNELNKAYVEKTAVSISGLKITK